MKKQLAYTLLAIVLSSAATSCIWEQISGLHTVWIPLAYFMALNVLMLVVIHTNQPPAE